MFILSSDGYYTGVEEGVHTAEDLKTKKQISEAHMNIFIFKMQIFMPSIPASAFELLIFYYLVGCSTP